MWCSKTPGFVGLFSLLGLMRCSDNRLASPASAAAAAARSQDGVTTHCHHESRARGMCIVQYGERPNSRLGLLPRAALPGTTPSLPGHARHEPLIPSSCGPSWCGAAGLRLGRAEPRGTPGGGGAGLCGVRPPRRPRPPRPPWRAGMQAADTVRRRRAPLKRGRNK